MKRLFLFFSLFVLIIGVTFSQQNDNKEAIDLESAFLGDVVRNFNGGIHPGNTGVGLFHLAATFHTDRAKMWKGGNLFLHAHKSVGGHPSEQLIGDIQVASNIDGFTNRFIYELWYSQTFGKFSLLAGLHNLNDVFNVSDYASLFLNSSFGIAPSLSLNNEISIYPITTLGGFFRWDTDKFSIINGWYNYGHEFTREETFNFRNHNFHGGFYSLLEAQYRIQRERETLVEFKVGATYKHCTNSNWHKTEECTVQNRYGLYFLTDYNLYKNEKGRSLDMFLQTGYSPGLISKSPFYLGFGMNLNNVFSRGKGDKLGLAIATAQINNLNTQTFLYNYYINESIVELTYKLCVHKHISIQPDLQYIINPAEIENAGNAFVGLFRTEIKL